MRAKQNSDASKKGRRPLYGRATGIYKMKEMGFYDAARFFPDRFHSFPFMDSMKGACNR